MGSVGSIRRISRPADRQFIANRYWGTCEVQTHSIRDQDALEHAHNAQREKTCTNSILTLYINSIKCGLCIPPLPDLASYKSSTEARIEYIVGIPAVCNNAKTKYFLLLGFHVCGLFLLFFCTHYLPLSFLFDFLLFFYPHLSCTRTHSCIFPLSVHIPLSIIRFPHLCDIRDRACAQMDLRIYVQCLH